MDFAWSDPVGEFAVRNLMFLRRVKPVERSRIEFGRQTFEGEAQSGTGLVHNQQDEVVTHPAHRAEDSPAVNRVVGLRQANSWRLERRSDEGRFERPEFARHPEQIAPEPCRPLTAEPSSSTGFM